MRKTGLSYKLTGVLPLQELLDHPFLRPTRALAAAPGTGVVDQSREQLMRQMISQVPV